ncbi:MAG: GntR family transcriptional regulator [Bacteroidetes bacterium]|nr:GntR family transcriptional regulator [Bacteroidota bacterium]
MSQIDRNKPLPLQHQLYIELKKWFTEDFSVNESLPTEVAIAEKYSISRGTVRIALDTLVKEGIITRIPGRGSFLNTDYFIRLKNYKIGIILSDIDFFSNSIWEYVWANHLEIINGIISNGHDYNITVVLLSEKHFSQTDNERFHGYIVWPYVHNDVIKQLEKPHVLLKYKIDMKSGFAQIAEDVVKQQYQHIGFIGFTAGGRIEVMNEIFKAHDMPEIPEDCIVECGGSQREAYRSCMNILQANPDIDCIICSTDLRAQGVVAYLHELNIPIPSQTAVYGFDGAERDTTISDPFTTCIFDWSYPGLFGVQSIRAALDSQELPVFIPSKGRLVKRNFS